MLSPTLSLFVRRRITARVRTNSKEASGSKSLAIMDVNRNAVVSATEKHQVRWLIHGHTHRPAVHELIADQQPAFRVILGAWHTEDSMVKVMAGNVELIHFSFQKTHNFADFTATQPFPSLSFRAILYTL